MNNDTAFLFDNCVIRLVRGDITELHVDAIVNAANERLAHGAGVAGAVSSKGGPIIQQESDEWIRKYGPVATGDVAVTAAGNLDAKFVIHAVGPIMGSGDEEAKLLSAVRKSLQNAEALNLKSIAFPAISTGSFGFPIERCARIMVDEAVEHLKNSALNEVVFCLWDQHSFEVFKQKLVRQKED